MHVLGPGAHKAHGLLDSGWGRVTWPFVQALSLYFAINALYFEADGLELAPGRTPQDVSATSGNERSAGAGSLASATSRATGREEVLLRMPGAAPDGVKPRALVHVKANAAISLVSSKASRTRLSVDKSGWHPAA